VSVRHKLDRLRAELARDDLDRAGRWLRVAELSLAAARLSPLVGVGHGRIYELVTPPRPFRGLRDFIVRRAGPGDTAALVELDRAPRALVAARLERGDLAYVGELAGKTIAHAWFHRGPEPFDEDLPLFPRWGLPADAFWSYHAVTLPEARASGVFVKVFHVALRELFVEHGAARVRCRVTASNAPAIALHERTGFRCLGTVVALAAPGVRWMSWHGDGGAWRRIGRRDRAVVSLPSEAA